MAWVDKVRASITGQVTIPPKSAPVVGDPRQATQTLSSTLSISSTQTHTRALPNFEKIQGCTSRSHVGAVPLRPQDIIQSATVTGFVEHGLPTDLQQNGPSMVKGNGKLVAVVSSLAVTPELEGTEDRANGMAEGESSYPMNTTPCSNGSSAAERFTAWKARVLNPPVETISSGSVHMPMKMEAWDHEETLVSIANQRHLGSSPATTAPATPSTSRELPMATTTTLSEPANVSPWLNALLSSPTPLQQSCEASSIATVAPVLPQAVKPSTATIQNATPPARRWETVDSGASVTPAQNEPTAASPSGSSVEKGRNSESGPRSWLNALMSPPPPQQVGEIRSIPRHSSSLSSVEAIVEAKPNGKVSRMETKGCKWQGDAPREVGRRRSTGWGRVRTMGGSGSVVRTETRIKAGDLARIEIKRCEEDCVELQGSGQRGDMITSSEGGDVVTINVLPGEGQTIYMGSEHGKVKFLFPKMSPTQRGRLRFDEESLWSVTDQNTADQISSLLLRLPGVTEDTVVLDGTACVGGNVISFAGFFKTVWAVEINRGRFELLQGNVKEAGISDKVCLFNADFLDVLEKEVAGGGEGSSTSGSRSQPLVFLDPPWGGVDYKKQEEVCLFMSELPLAEVCQRAAAAGVRHVAIKVPLNFEVENFTVAVKGRVTVHQRNMRKMLLVLVDFSRRPCPPPQLSQLTVMESSPLRRLQQRSSTQASNAVVSRETALAALAEAEEQREAWIFEDEGDCRKMVDVVSPPHHGDFGSGLGLALRTGTVVDVGEGEEARGDSELSGGYGAEGMSVVGVEEDLCELVQGASIR